MFNAVQKQRYIDEYVQITKSENKQTIAKNMLNFFNRLSQYEQNMGHDFSCFSRREIEETLAIMCGQTSTYQNSVLSTLRKYLDWCISNNLSLDCENRLIGLSMRDIDTTRIDRSCMFSDEKNLDDKLNLVLSAIELYTIDNRTRVIVHLLFNGLQYRQIFSLKKQDVNLSEKTASVGDETIPLSDQCCTLIGGLNAMTEFTVGPDSAGVRSSYKIVDTGHVIENSRGNRKSMQASIIPVISNLFTQIREATEDPIASNMTNVLMSGIAYRTFQAGEDMTILESEYARIITDKSNQVRHMRDWYVRWKKAFGLVSIEA